MKLSKVNRYLYLFGLTKIPLVFYVAPKILEFTEKHILLKIKSRRKTRNHLKSMYIGSMVVGADISSGFLAFLKTQDSNKKISLMFKSITGEFLKRPMGDCYFLCENGLQIDNMIKNSEETGERFNEFSEIKVYTDYYKEKELVAIFKMELSIKVK
jgi:hypothetical protein